MESASRQHLALELAATVRHDGQGGVADDLETVAGLAAWLAGREPALPATELTGPAGHAALAEVVALRQALRALLAVAVRPGPPSRADAGRLLPADEAVARLNSAAARVPVTPRLEWRIPEETAGAPAAELVPAEPSQAPGTAVALSAALSRAAMDFLTGPDRERLRSCAAPRCVRYFLRTHGRQEFCKTSCSNRARAARHYRRTARGQGGAG